MIVGSQWLASKPEVARCGQAAIALLSEQQRTAADIVRSYSEEQQREHDRGSAERREQQVPRAPSPSAVRLAAEWEREVARSARRSPRQGSPPPPSVG